MDGTRIHDIAVLTKVLNDPDESALHKRQAQGSLRRIYATLRDPVIKKERERLIRAQIAGDSDEAEKISNLIYQHSMRTYGFA